MKRERYRRKLVVIVSNWKCQVLQFDMNKFAYIFKTHQTLSIVRIAHILTSARSTKKTKKNITIELRYEPKTAKITQNARRDMQSEELIRFKRTGFGVCNKHTLNCEA